MRETPHVWKFGKSGSILLVDLSRSDSDLSLLPAVLGAFFSFLSEADTIVQQCGYLMAFPAILWLGDCLENYCYRLMNFIYYFTYPGEETESFNLFYFSGSYMERDLFAGRTCAV